MPTIDGERLRNTRSTQASNASNGKRRAKRLSAKRLSAKRRAKRLSGKRRAKRLSGTAYMESLIVLPALILVFGLVMFVRQGYTKAGIAASQTRQHGWTHVMSSCTSSSVPTPTHMDAGSNWSFAAIAAIAGSLRSAATIIRNQPMAVASGQALTIGSFYIERHEFSQSATFSRPGAIGGTAKYGHRIALTCDEDYGYLKMPGLIPGSLPGLTWSFSIWNETAWLMADL